MQIYNIRHFRDHMSKLTSSLSPEIPIVIMKNKNPAFIVSPLDENLFLKMKLECNVLDALREIDELQTFSHKKIGEKLNLETNAIDGSFYNLLYTNISLVDFKRIGKKASKRILKKLFEMVHRSNPTNNTRPVDILEKSFSLLDVGRFEILLHAKPFNKEEYSTNNKEKRFIPLLGNIYVLGVISSKTKKEKYRL